MKEIKKVTGTALLILVIAFKSAGQEYGTYFPEIGKPLKDFTLTDLRNSPEKTISLTDFRGKWLLLDFWGYSCSACIASFPKMDALNEQYKDKVQLIMIGATKGRSNEPEKKISAITKRLYLIKEKKHNLKFTVAFDSVLYLKYNIEALPHILLVDPHGIVRAKAQSLSAAQINSFLNGQTPLYERQYSVGEKTPAETYNKGIPFLTNGALSNGGVDTAFIYRSLLSKWNPEGTPFISRSNLALDSLGKLELAGYPLNMLILLACTNLPEWTPDRSLYGNFSLNLILEIKDSSMFGRENRNKYAYSLISKKHDLSTSELQKILQSDIQNAFGFSVSIEIRKMPVWNLVVSDIKKLKRRRTNGGAFSGREIGPHEGMLWKNISIKRFVEMNIWTNMMWELYHHDKFKIPPVINATGLDWTINMDFKADMDDFEEMKVALNRNGLDLVAGKKEMKVIVIRDNE